ncbi:hypothetical protein OGAPHI_003392 [Ogataea philodendri]|uniref:Uncharacterized protein n=1 Tax=Ogataea philodendri TaxID=1378263 RepID=A0A9P8P8V1_9ASCO|nr:uncharacterized protein OGAPHI_003392 [Ogataea philodendri]KAH3666942.1 hypothetical protein OGAPHI_003392 [Ogataea philodendri]
MASASSYSLVQTQNVAASNSSSAASSSSSAGASSLNSPISYSGSNSKLVALFAGLFVVDVGVPLLSDNDVMNGGCGVGTLAWGAVAVVSEIWILIEISVSYSRFLSREFLSITEWWNSLVRLTKKTSRCKFTDRFKIRSTRKLLWIRMMRETNITAFSRSSAFRLASTFEQ